MTPRRLRIVAHFGLGSCFALLGACQDPPPAPGSTSPPAGNAPASSASSNPQAEQLEAVAAAARQQQAEAVAKSINPSGLPPYSGPVGGLKGRVLLSGDPAPTQLARAAKIPEQGCPRAQQLYRKLFRQGPDGSLADVLVTVTEYQGFIAAEGDVVRVRAEGCAWNSRTVALTFGQHLEVQNLDSQPYMPSLEGAPTPALRIAVPHGAPVPLFFPRPGKFGLVEATRDYMHADVFVLNYPTARVTELDGRFDFDDLPVGEVHVTAYLPALAKAVDQRIKIEAGTSAELTLTIPFSLAEYEASKGGHSGTTLTS
jgi:hypothetical protein